VGDDNRDSWDGFDAAGWGETSDGAVGDSASGNGATPRYGDEDETPREGQWVTEGGVLKWEEPDGGENVASDLRAEAGSRWAADDLDLPLGAPESTRLRAVRAWLARQHLLENEAIGFLLLERRRLQADLLRDEGGDEVPETRGGRGADDDPISLAVAEHQAAIEEYEGMLGALDDLAVHSGSSRVLVEFFLLINERLLDLASAPAAPDDFARRHFLPAAERSAAMARPTAKSQAEWQGHAEAVLRTRSRVERMSAPEPEE
jgi:hypothetical protein